jgi:hypothetical protein
MIKMININELEEGYIVAEPVRNKFRQVILSQGSQITNYHRQILKTWNINSIKIIFNSNSAQEDTNIQDISSEAHKLVSKRCTWIPENKWEESLYDLAIKNEIKKLLNNTN